MRNFLALLMFTVSLSASAIEFETGPAREAITMTLYKYDDTINSYSLMLLNERGLIGFSINHSSKHYSNGDWQSKGKYYFPVAGGEGYLDPKKNKAEFDNLIRLMEATSPYCPLTMTVNPNNWKILKVSLACDPSGR